MNLIIIVVIVLALLIAMNKYQNMRGNFSFWIILIFLSLFAFSLFYVVSSRNIDISSFEGFQQAGKAYISWLSVIFDNMGSTVGYATKQDWGLDSVNFTSNKTGVK